ncbi:MAG: hypothetical protein HYR63_06380 [Proteobacteria bacterium]|nr:hypothetical protein [Pseudomonadota bacterium]MBI3495963.1 hypothetical protein [Pseudomonadota bacterium]
MQIVSAKPMDYKPVSGHRTGDITFKRLVQGAPGAIDNFELSLVRNAGSYYTPRHRHNFDQVRMVLAGEFGYAGRKTMPVGSIGYFPEGTYYGPQNVESCITLTLQCGAPSGDGFLSYDQLHNGHIELSQLGRFEQGVFYRNPDSNRRPGVKRNQDGYEAIWEHVMGRKLRYPKARYTEPVIMLPEAYDWRPTETPGIANKLLGVFVNNTRIELLRLDAGAAHRLSAERAIHLLFALKGAGSCNGESWGPETAIKVERDEQARLVASESAEVLLIAMAELAPSKARELPKVA